MEFKLVSTKESTDRVLNVYAIGEYEVRVVTRKTGWRSIDIFNKGNRFTPDIIYMDDLTKENSEGVFLILTTSYGGLTCEEMKQLISKLETATSVVEILNQEFTHVESFND